MAIQPRFRIAAALGALIAPLALVAATAAPADAGALKRHKHEVTMYKVEKYLKLKGGASDPSAASGETLATSLRCTSSQDSVLDGMWLVQHVDQYNEPQPEPNDPDDIGFPTIPSDTNYTGATYHDARDVFVWWSYPSVDKAQWEFKFQNFADGDAQLKVYITCIKARTEANGHSHSIDVSVADDLAQGTSLAGDRYYADRSKCGAGEYYVAPGFKINDNKKSRLISSHPLGTSGWRWQFAATDTSNISFYGKCLKNTVGLAGSPAHRHGIAMRQMPGFAAHITPGDPNDAQYTCDQDDSTMHGYKAMVGAFYTYNPLHTWFLGMEPRPKTRVYLFQNEGPGNAQVDLGALCVNSRTSNPLQ